MENPLVFFLYYLEEGIALAVLGPALLGIRPGIKKVIGAGLLQGIVNYLCKNALQILHVPPFTHRFLLVIALMIVLKYVFGSGWGISSAASLLSFLWLFVSELILLPIFYYTFDLTWNQVSASLKLNILSAYIGDLLFFAVTITVAETGFSIVNFHKTPR